MYYCIIFQKKPIPPPLMVNGISKGEGRGGIKWLKFPAAWGQGCCLTGSQAPEAPPICSRATKIFKQGAQTGT